MRSRFAALALFVVLFCTLGVALGAVPQPQKLPADLTGTLDGVAYKIRVPANWNGTLLVFAHATQLGEPAAEVAPKAYPAPATSLEEQLLGLGYALAGSGFRNSDKEGVQHTLALTGYFRDVIGNPSRIIVWGNSAGSRVALKLIEEHPGIYDAALALAAVATGTPENMDSALTFSLAYDAAFGWPADKWGPLENLRDDLTSSEALAQVKATTSPILFPATRPRWEFIRLIMQLPKEAFWNMDGLTQMPFWLLQTWKATAIRAAAEADCKGPFAENVGMEYALTTAEKTYLASLGVTNVEEMLAYMNARANIAADIPARKHAEQWGAFDGRIRRPVLTVHSKYDGMAPVTMESYYRKLVHDAGADGLLVQAYVDAITHASFTVDQLKSAVAAINYWLDTGKRPGSEQLPASQGFDLAHVPGPWIF